jgi:hypothetical protein
MTEFLKNEEPWRVVEHGIVALATVYGVKKLFGGKGFVANVSGFVISIVKAAPGLISVNKIKLYY